MATVPKFQTGDRLILRRLQGLTEDVEVVVYKTGRKWGYAKPEGRNYPDVKFDLETGHEDAVAYTSRFRVLTSEQDVAEKAHDAALRRLKGLGVDFGYGEARKFSAEALERVGDILDQDIA